MRADEFAVLFANLQPINLGKTLGPVAVVFATCDKAKAYAHMQIAKEPRLRCTIYDSRGMGAPPLAVIAGAQGADTNFISSKFRLWGGGVCLSIGVALGLAEWLSGMSLTWPGLIAARIGPVGALLLLMEVGVRLSEHQKRKRL